MPVRHENVAALLGVKTKSRKELSKLDLADAVRRGIPLSAVDRVLQSIAPHDVALRNRIVPKATLARRRSGGAPRLSPRESDRVARMASLWTIALDVWGSADAAQRFLREPHPLLDGRVPNEVAVDTEIGARTVEDILGRLKYGSAP
jgi:putative toxin-antitoxin system antitoxin component (TIGR02293 family)